MLGIVESGVSAGVDAVDDGLHAMLDQHVVVAEQGVDGLLVHVPALVAVHQDLSKTLKSIKNIANLVVVSGFQHHVKNCLVEFVLDEKVCVKESLEDLKQEKVKEGREPERFKFTSTTWWYPRVAARNTGGVDPDRIYRSSFPEVRQILVPFCTLTISTFTNGGLF